MTGACGGAPSRLHLRPKSFAVLHYLLRHAGQLVSRDALLQAVWPDVVVSEAMLTICLGELRRALGETRQAPRCIETVARRGYRFIAPVTRAGRQGASGPGRAPAAPCPCGPGAAGGAGGGVGAVAGVVGAGAAGGAAGGVCDRGGGDWQDHPGGRLVCPAGRGGPPAGGAGAVSGPPRRRGKRTCRCWRRWGSCAAGPGGQSWWRSWRSMPPPGCCRCPPCSARPSWRGCTAGCSGRPRSACCGSWPRRWRC